MTPGVVAAIAEARRALEAVRARRENREPARDLVGEAVARAEVERLRAGRRVVEGEPEGGPS